MKIDEMNLPMIWETIEQKLKDNPDPIKDMQTTYSILLTGDDGGLYGLLIDDGKVEVTTDEIEADCALSLSVKDFKKLLTGNLNSTASYMMGKLKVKGSLGLALKLESLLKEYAFD